MPYRKISKLNNPEKHKHPQSISLNAPCQRKIVWYISNKFMKGSSRNNGFGESICA